MHRPFKLLLTFFLVFLGTDHCLAQYLDVLCPNCNAPKNEERFEEMLVELNKCLAEVKNKSDSLLIYANMPLAYQGLKENNVADSIISELIQEEYQQYFRSYAVVLERLGRKHMFSFKEEDKQKTLRYFFIADSVSGANDFLPGVARNKSNLANMYYVIHRDFEKAYEYYMASLQLDEIPEEYHFSTISGAFLAATKTEQPTADSLQTLGLTYINENLTGTISAYDSSKISIFYGVMGSNYFNNGQLRLAAEQNIAAAEIRPKSKEYKYGLNRLYFNISKIFIALSNSDKALEYAELLRENAEKYEFNSYQIQAIALKASIYMNQKSFDTAKGLYKRFLERSKELKIPENSLLLTAHTDLAFIYHTQDSIAFSKQHLDKSEIYLEKSKGNHIPTMNYYDVEITLLLREKRYRKAEEVAKKLLDLSLKYNDPHFKKKASKSLSQIYTGLKNHEKAYHFLAMSHQIEDSLFRNEQNFIVHDLEAKYLKKEQGLEISKLKFVDEKNKLRISAQKRTIWLGAIGLALVSLLSFFLFRSGRRIRSQNTIIEKSLSEKELLLKEIHHRVKNNLQVVSSLLSLQSEYIKDDTALSAINEGRNRVRSMALIHQNLYSEENLTGIQVKSYLEKLIDGLFNTYNIKQDEIGLKLDIENIELDVDIVVPLGLIANELVSNALKHAFDGKEDGLISVQLTTDNEALSFIVKDNGKGIDDSFEIEEMDSFGYQMISAFKEKLQADLSIINKDGTQVSLRIKDYKKLSNGN